MENKKFFNGKELKEWVNNEDLLFMLTDKEANLIVEYLGYRGTQIYAEGLQLKMSISTYPVDVKVAIDEIIDEAMDIHYDIMNTCEAKMINSSGREYRKIKKDYNILKKHQSIFDHMFSRTMYGKKKVGCFA